MGQKREFFRVAIERVGHIHRGTENTPCDVLDLTEKGVQLKTDLPVTTGEELQLEFNLTETCPLQCTIQVTYVKPPHFGACIIRISPEHRKQLSQFIEQLNALNMTGF